MRTAMDHNRLSYAEDGRVISYTPHPEYDRVLDNTPGQDGYPWGTVVNRKVVTGEEIIKAVDHMRPGRFTWHVDGHGYDTEAEAVLHAGMVAMGINVNHVGTAISMVKGLVREEER